MCGKGSYGSKEFYDVTDDELLGEVDARGLIAPEIDHASIREWLELVWQKRRTGQDYQLELDQVLYLGLGKIL